MDRYNTDAAEVPRESTFSEKMGNHLGNVNEELQAAYGRLDKLYSRVFGARPEPPNGAGKLQAVPSSASGELLEAVQRSLSHAYAINGLISDLERAL